jgi:signal recognition particle subunit SEC65
MNNNQALSHYGILGMHWGVTRASSGSSVSGSTAKRQAQKDAAEARKSPDHKEGRVLYNKPVSEMSNDEIMKLTRRINLEKQVRDIHPNAYKKGMNIVKDVTAAGVTIGGLYALTQSPVAGRIANAALTKKIAKRAIQSPLAKAIAKAVAKAALKVG